MLVPTFLNKRLFLIFFFQTKTLRVVIIGPADQILALNDASVRSEGSDEPVLIKVSSEPVLLAYTK